MSKSSRILVAIASLGLLLVFVLPLWSIHLQAPQYPEGLGLQIGINSIEGDLRSINGLNHYIGMKPIEPDAIPELRFMPWIVAGLVGLGLLVAATGSRRLLHLWFGLIVLCAVAGLVDFWKWEYDYGHNLDQENAIIKVPGMDYQPPLIGSRQLLNFVATSWPAAGGWVAISATLLGFFVIVRERRTPRAAHASHRSVRHAPAGTPVEAR